MNNKCRLTHNSLFSAGNGFFPERYEDEDYEYGHSYEDRYCVSPSTGRLFCFVFVA